MGGGTYTFLTLPGTSNVALFRCIELTVAQTKLRRALSARMFSTRRLRLCCASSSRWVSSKVRPGSELSYLSRLTSLSIDPYPYADYNETLRSESTRELLHQMEQETIVLLENHGVLPLASDTKSIALIGPQMGRVSVSLCHVWYLLDTGRLTNITVRRLRLLQRL